MRFWVVVCVFLCFCYLKGQGDISGDSITALLHEGETLCNNGRFVEAETVVAEALRHHSSVAYTGLDKNYMDSIGFQLKIIYGWSKTLQGKYSEAKPVFDEIIYSLPDTAYVLKAECYVRMSSMYGMQGIYDLAEVCAAKALDAATAGKDMLTIYRARAFLGDTYCYTGQYEKALAEYYELRRLSVMMDYNNAMTMGKMGVIYHRLKDYPLAGQYYIESLSLSKGKEPVTHSLILSQYCRYLLDLGDYRGARMLAREELERGVALDDVEKNLLKIMSETSRPYMWFVLKWAFGMVALVIALAVCVMWLVHRRKKKSWTKKAWQSSQNPDRTLTAKDLQVIGLIETLPHISEVVKELRGCVAAGEPVDAGLKKLEQAISALDCSQIEKDYSMYVERHDGFAKVLKEHVPDLTSQDVRLCILIKKGLTTKDIAGLTNRSVRSVESARFRLRKKLGIKTSEDIYDFLMKMK